MKTYIASPFFDKDGIQLKQVMELEQLLTALGDEFYSPRQHGNISEIQVGEQLVPLKMRLVFEDNINAINECGRMIVNLFNNRDIGTLFELGYAIAKKKQINVLCLNPGFGEVGIEFNDVATQRYAKMRSDTNIFEMFKFLEDMNEKFISGGDPVKVDTNEDASFPAGIMLLGYLYGRDIPAVYISSFKSKSNIMITEANIVQYASMEDYENHKPVIYNNKDIQ